MWETRKTDWKAVASVFLAISSQVGCFAVGMPSGLVVCYVIGVPAIILGHISRSQIKRSDGELRGAGIALVGLILGYLGVVTSVANWIMYIVPQTRH